MKRNRTFTIMIAVLIVALPQLSFARGSSFENNLNSPLIVSPAQASQVEGRGLRLDMAAASSFEKHRAVGSTSGLIINHRTQNIDIASIFSLDNIGLFLGVKGSFARSRTDFKSSTEDNHIDTNAQTFTPLVAYCIGPFVLGVESEIYQDKSPAENGDDYTTSRSVHNRLAALIRVARAEAGLFYVPKSTHTTTETKIDSIQERAVLEKTSSDTPASYGLHGRFAASANTYLGAIFEYIENKKVDESKKDYRRYSMSFEQRFGSAVKLESLLTYQEDSFAEKDSANADEIAHTKLAGELSYKVTPKARIGTMGGFTAGTRDMERNGEEQKLSVDRFELGLSTIIKL